MIFVLVLVLILILIVLILIVLILIVLILIVLVLVVLVLIILILVVVLHFGNLLAMRIYHLGMTVSVFPCKTLLYRIPMLAVVSNLFQNIF